MTEEHFTELERRYHSARINHRLEPEMTVSLRSAVIRMAVGPHLFHASEAVHGSVLFKLLDDAAYFAANSMIRDSLLLTVEFTTHFVRPVSEGVLVAKGRLLHEGRTRSIAESVVQSQEQKVLAYGRGSYARGQPLLPI
jgi:uncharacterized protein (TIGR00369 family)